MAPATSFAALALLLGGAAAYDNGAKLGALPPRGWATWCTDDICGLLDFCNEAEVQQVADALGACVREMRRARWRRARAGARWVVCELVRECGCAF